MSKLIRVNFHMRSGSTVTAEYVETVEMTRRPETGDYAGYRLEFEKGRAPRLFTVSIPDIVAVVATDM